MRLSKWLFKEETNYHSRFRKTKEDVRNELKPQSYFYEQCRKVLNANVAQVLLVLIVKRLTLAPRRRALIMGFALICRRAMKAILINVCVLTVSEENILRV